MDVAQARHSSAVGKTRQQDMLRAQLEITRLEDRLYMLFQQYDTAVKVYMNGWQALPMVDVKRMGLIASTLFYR